MKYNLEVEGISLFPKENAKKHRTYKYETVHDDENPTAVLRRGQTFKMQLKFFNGSFDENKDIVKLIFNYGSNPNALKGTQGVLKVDFTGKICAENTDWSCEILKKDDKCLSFEVCTPHNIPIGLWKLQVRTLKPETTPEKFDYVNDIYFLCNPWNSHDSTYMPETKLLDEYVLADAGKIWVGSSNNPGSRAWVFGQFDDIVLPTIMMIFNRSKMPHSSLGDPIQICRMVSKMVNANDDNGVLLGKWRDFKDNDGTLPSAWTGSVPILQEYYDTKTPVRYGQCWVFAALVTTICRALGIPSRVVSNFDSAHDYDNTFTIDNFYDENNKFDDGKTIDSIWNFHVWNDVYIARPDLPSGYGGWQAIDATPQELSGGFYQCGPTSLEAVRKGEVGYNYDTHFLISTVNSDVVHWKEDPTSEIGYSRIYSDTRAVGRFLLTKKPMVDDPYGNEDCEDVINQYKMPEGTKAERLQLFNSIRHNPLARIRWEMPHTEIRDVEFKLKNLEKVKIGDGVDLIINIENKSDQVRTINAVLSSGSVYYTGVKSHTIKESHKELKMKPQSTAQLSMTVKSDQYMDKLVEHGIIKLDAIATVKETGQTWLGKDDIQIIKPKININIPTDIIAREPTLVRLSFVNPMKKWLTDCKINVAGSSMLRNQVVRCSDVGPGKNVEVDVTVVPKIKGELTLVATFSSNELFDISGSVKATVKPNIIYTPIIMA
ncbi:unnamed protein product [Brassicogethes aeneus]|uniref:Transglutaminase-like domain-containing protein n=1 Tax=Brassicogethes aeneus TaxID=1431903 RepID=A0A9P0FB12_BRAAE|nr:unnamed protein product [Brassicogethes aeneus]